MQSLKSKILITLLFTFGLLLLFYNIAYADSSTVVNSGYYGYSDWGQISFTYDSDWYTYLQNNCPYLNDSDYYRIIFNTSNASNRLIYKYALFIKKSDLATGVVPFTVNIANSNAPGNVTRQIVVNNVGGTIYEYGWYNGSPWSSSYVNQGTGNWNIQYWQNTANYELLYCVWSTYDSTTFNIAGNIEHYTFPDEIPPFVAPTIDLDTTSVSENGLNGFAVYGGSISPSDSMTIKFYNGYNNTNSNDLIEAYTLNENSGWYVNIHETGQYAGQSYFYITNRFMSPPLNNVTGNSYTIELTYPGATGTENIYKYWTFNLSTTVEENIESNVQQDTLHAVEDLNNTINETNSFLTNSNVDENTILDNMPSFTVNSDSDNQLNSIFQALNDAFTSDTYNDFSFTIPFSNSTITIPSNYLEEHLPSIIVNLIRLFYWYIISRYILLDVFEHINRLRQGDYFLRSETNIKTEVL